MKKIAMMIPLAAASVFGTPVFEHAIYDATSLDGALEMSYLPYSWETADMPKFAGARIENAVPGYWEDMVDAFRAAGIKDEFRINPLCGKRTFPIIGYAPEMALPNIRGTFLYRRMVELTSSGSGPAVLAFEGVRNQVHVWINGEFVAFRAGFSVPFEIEIPEGVLRKGANEIVLAVSNDLNLGYCGAHVTGLVTRSVFGATGGVNGHLELRFPRNGLADVYVTTAADLKSFTVHVSDAKEFGYEILDGGRCAAKGSASGDFTVSTEGFEFWSPESPKRYELRISTPQGRYSQMFGIRRLVAVGEKLRLNGRPVYLRGVGEHCYYPKTVHVPRDLDYYRMVTAKRKELGFNLLRFHTYVPPVEYLEATDELGMLVHVETPNFVAEPEFEAVVAFARRHPSVVIYCTGNETRIDRLAEAYLRDVADIVHRGTDSLFSPMNALRGVEYRLVPGKEDSIVDRPFSHNPERMKRLAAYSDLFNSYQLGMLSYDSLNVGTSADIDAWGDAYCGKPRLAHEICIDGSYADLGTEKLYPAGSPILKTGLFSGLRRQLEDKGLLDRADTYFRNSCEWMWRIRKHCFEKVRAADRISGYDFLGDVNVHWHTFGYSVGMMDEFYRLKPGESVENVLRYNSAAVLLSDLGSDFNVFAGERRDVAFSVSNYDADAPDAMLHAELIDCGGKAVWSGEMRCGDVANGKLTRLGSFAVAVPAAGAPEKYVLRAEFAGGGVRAANEWEMYAFPKVASVAPAEGVTVLGEDATAGEVAAWLAKGRRVALFGAGSFRSLETTYRIGLAGRCYGNAATVVKKGHPALEGLPHDGYCGWQFRRLMEGGRAVQLEEGVPFDPIVDVASSVKYVIRQAMLFEYRVGQGRLLVCSFRFQEGDPAAAWLRRRLLEYAASEAFAPELKLTADQLRALFNAPLRSGRENANRARNPNDPASRVREGVFAQP